MGERGHDQPVTSLLDLQARLRRQAGERRVQDAPLDPLSIAEPDLKVVEIPDRSAPAAGPDRIAALVVRLERLEAEVTAATERLQRAEEARKQARAARASATGDEPGWSIEDRLAELQNQITQRLSRRSR